MKDNQNFRSYMRGTKVNLTFVTVEHSRSIEFVANKRRNVDKKFENKNCIAHDFL